MYLLIENLEEWRPGMVIVAGALVGTCKVVSIESLISKSQENQLLDTLSKKKESSRIVKAEE